MRSLRYFGLLAGLSLLLTQCSDSDEGVFTQAGVTTRVAGETIVIKNNHGEPISYFIAEVEALKAIRWVPVSYEENTILQGDTKVIPWTDIAAGGLLNERDEIIIHWWLAQDSTVTSSEINRHFLTL